MSETLCVSLAVAGVLLAWAASGFLVLYAAHRLSREDGP